MYKSKDSVSFLMLIFNRKKRKKKKEAIMVFFFIDFKAIVIDGFEWVSIKLSKSSAFSLQTSENNLKPP